jgi:arsenite methyltransferase
MTPERDRRVAHGSARGCAPGGAAIGALSAAGFIDTSVTFTRQRADGIHQSIVRATKPEASAGH